MPLIEKLMIAGVLGGCCVIAAVEVCFCIDFIRAVFKKNSRKSRILSKPAVAVHIIALIGGLCFAYGLFVEAYWVQVNHFTIQTDKLEGASFRVVQITDTHCDKTIRNERKMVEIVNGLGADVVVFTGDEINTTKAIGNFQDAMRKLNAPIGKYAIRGNWFQSVDSNELFENTGFNVLEADKVKLEKNGESITVAGVNFFNPSEYHRVLRNNAIDCFNIFLYHSPDLIEDVQGYNVDLYLAGHTHGGQVCLPFYGAILTFSKFGKKYEAGMYDVGPMKLYVNRGLGMEGGKAPRVRFFARPEIAVFDIVPESKSMK